MVEYNPESLLTLAEAAQKKLPHRANGKPLHVNTLFRWCNQGLRGVVLETVRVGGRVYTTERSIQEFCDRLRVPMRRNLQPARQQQQASASARRANEAARKALSLEGFNCAPSQAASA